MTKFAFIIHPIDLGYITKKIKPFKLLPGSLTERIVSHFPVYKASEIKGIKSPFAETEGWFIICPLTSRQMLELPEPYVLRRIIEAGKLAEKLGAEIVGLGAMTAVVGDAGITVAKNLGIAVTTGNSYTVAMALEGTKRAVEYTGVDMAQAKAVVLGATGSIGSVCAKILASEVGDLTLVSRTHSRLERLAHQILHETGTAVRLTTNTKEALRDADIVMAVTSSVDTIIEPQDLKPGAVVCDVARPRDVSVKVASERPDVLVIEGGVVDVPGDNVQFNFDFGFPPGTAYACMAETMILALEERCENYSLGRDLTVSQVREIQRLGEKHGFKLAGLRSFDRALTPEDLKHFKRTLDK
ncbi:MAG: shikimate dehydrogenase [Syntrophaceticus sp.]